MCMNEVTFLSNKNIFGEEKIDIIKKYGQMSSVTDFYLLQNGFVLNGFHVNGFLLDNRTGLYFTSSSYNDDSVYIVDHRGCKSVLSNIRRNCGVRPVLLWDLLKDPRVREPIHEIKYGEYPQTIVDDFTMIKLESIYQNNELEETGKKYTVDNSHNINSNAIFMPKDIIEYYYNGHKYIRFKTCNIDYCGNRLSNGRIIRENSVYWVKVEPIEWIVDFKTGLMLSKKILLAGIQYNNYKKSNTNFKESDIYNYLNKYFSKEIITSNFSTILDINSCSSSKQLVKIR